MPLCAAVCQRLTMQEDKEATMQGMLEELLQNEQLILAHVQEHGLPVS